MDSIFASTQRFLVEKIATVNLDHEAFETPLKPCDLKKCRATCCHDGVQLSQEDAELLEGVVENNRSTLAAYGLGVGGMVTERVAGVRYKTIARPAHQAELAEDFPAHFPQTKCIFLDSEHRCGLQRLAMDKGESPWKYKPFTCWMHPLLMREVRGNLTLTIANEANDPQKKAGYPGYGSCTHCGRKELTGRPAKEVLNGELEALSNLIGRDFVAELNSEEVDWY